MERESPSDGEAVAAVLTGNTDAFATLVERYQPRLYSYLFRFVRHREECEDLVEETFVAAFRKLGTCRTPDRFSSWLFAIAHNFGINRWRKTNRARRFETELDDAVRNTVPDESLDPHELSVKRDETKRVELALQQVPDKYRAVLLLYYYESLSYREISDALGISLDLVKTHLFRAKKILGQVFEAANSRGTPHNDSPRSVPGRPILEA
ncbi:RNA polymerase sigma factor [Candidatus Parcubacteria bacterium]|nr:RNA polymerase sigma factor [Candidatus Parcubacteria bacterium]